MSEKITPGPWTIDGVGLVVAPIAEEGGQFRIIADCRYNRVANSLAISAVPQMIEALVAARPIIAAHRALRQPRQSVEILAQLDTALKAAGIEL